MRNRPAPVVKIILYAGIVLIFLCQLAAAQSPGSDIPGAGGPQNTVLHGFLSDGSKNTPVGDGYVFVLSRDGEKILGYSRTKPGKGPDPGCFQVANLPSDGEVLLVGFHPSLEQNLAVGAVTLRGKYQQVEKFQTSISFDLPAGAKTLVEEQTELLQLISVIPCEVFKVMNNTEVARLPDTVLPRMPVCRGLNEPGYLSNESIPNAKFTAKYESIKKESADKVIPQYVSLPGGVILDGEGSGIGNVKKVGYDPENNIFVLDGDITYRSPVMPAEMKQIFQAVHADDRIGVASGDSQMIYGRLQAGSPLAIQLKLAASFLEDIVFNRLDLLADYHFSGQYIPKGNIDEIDAGRIAVYFNFNGYTFVETEKNIAPSGGNLTVHLIPLSETRRSDGGFLPDSTAIKAGKISEEFEENIEHIVKNIHYYMKERILRTVRSYGEAAAFARALKKNGIDLNALSLQL